MKTQKRGRCIFCLKPGLTREHIFPDWMRDYLEEGVTPAIHWSHHSVIKEGGKVALTPPGPGKFQRPGGVRSKKLRAVCKTCNSTWMSAIQNAAKPILIPLITGAWPSINASQRMTLAAWVTMFSMVLDAVHPENSGVSQEARALFMETLKPPPRWMIWTGVHERARTAAFSHHGYGLFDTSEEVQKIPAGAPMPCNAHANVFVCGHALFHTFSGPEGTPPFVYRLLTTTTPFDLVLLWPPVIQRGLTPPRAISYQHFHLVLERIDVALRRALTSL